MKSFNWLHLTDLHFGHDDQKSLWPNVREALWNDLERLHEKSGPWNAVLFTGDLVQSGKKEQFIELEEKVLGPLWTHLAKIGSKECALLAVPGNHDLLRPEYDKPKAALRYMLQKNGFSEIEGEFWDEPDCEYREIIAASFENYQDWSAKNSRNNGIEITQGVLPGDFVASMIVNSSEGSPLKIGIAGINTTFLQLTNGDFRKRLSLDTKQLNEACGGDLPEWSKRHDACILMTHQGPEWLEETYATEAYSEINPAGRFAVHLFGHMHENTIRSTAAGGGKIVRQWQGNSLFGLEKFGESLKTERRHGYSAGRIEFANDEATICHWPRKAVKDSNGWRFNPDHDSCVLIESESRTEPERLDYTGRSSKSPPESNGGTLIVKDSAITHDNSHLRHLQEMEMQLQHALEAFKGQPTIFIEPKLSKKREFNDDPNELHKLMGNPSDTLVIAPSEFGLTCLGLHMQLEAYKKNELWLYVDSDLTKGRKIVDHIEKELLHYNANEQSLKCLILDSWNSEKFDHLTMVKNISNHFSGVPLIILSEDSLIPDVAGNLSKLNRKFELLHLQALSKNSMRKLVADYNKAKCIGTEDVVLSSLAGHLESINIHRTPLNCYTLLRVLDSSYNEKLLNKSKLLKAILFLLFTDHNSFSFLSEKPEVDECSFVLGSFCKDLVKEGTRHFDSATLAPRLREICNSNGIVLNVDAMLSVLRENNILVSCGDQMFFRHRYWIFYFAAEWMRHDDEFRLFVFNDRNYVNYPEIIEFYTGIDGKRTDALERILSDLTILTDQVDNKIGIDRNFDPLTPLLWNPTDEYLQQARCKIAEKVESSNLPVEIKDKHADKEYRSAAPYDQSVSRFLKDYSVLSLMHSIKAASCALRSSPFVKFELRKSLANAIFQGWEEISKVVFWLSPILAKEGRAIHDGFAVRLEEGFSSDLDQRFNEIIVANPCNIVRILGPDLASKKILPLVSESFRSTDSFLQKHMMALFVVAARPIGWQDSLYDYINRLNSRSFYLGDIMSRLTQEITFGDLEQGDELALKRLTRAIISKREYAPKVAGSKEIARNKILSDENTMPIDQMLKGNRQRWHHP